MEKALCRGNNTECNMSTSMMALRLCVNFHILQEFHFDVQTIEVRDDSFSVESNQCRDKDFEKFKKEAAEDKVN